MLSSDWVSGVSIAFSNTLTHAYCLSGKAKVQDFFLGRDSENDDGTDKCGFYGTNVCLVLVIVEAQNSVAIKIPKHDNHRFAVLK